MGHRGWMGGEGGQIETKREMGVRGWAVGAA